MGIQSADDFNQDYWEQPLPGESPLWFDRFQRYLAMGPGRSVKAAFAMEKLRSGKMRSKNIPGSLYEKVAHFQWNKRVAAYERYQSYLTRLATEERLRQIQEMEWENSMTMAKKAREMAEFPLTKQTIVDDENGRTVIIEPARWHMGDACQFFKMSSEIGRRAIGKNDGQMDELKAIEVLVEAGWLPAHVKDAALKGLDYLKEEVQSAFEKGQEKEDAIDLDVDLEIDGVSNEDEDAIEDES